MLNILSKTTVIGAQDNQSPPEIIKPTMDFMLYFLLIAIVGIGLVAIYSASIGFHGSHNGLFYLQRQILALLIGVFIMVMVMQLPNQAVRWLARWSLLFALILLIAVFLPGIGHKAGGAVRWVGASGFYFQPAEFAKVAFILFVADFVNRRPNIFRGKFLEQWPLLLIVTVMGFVLYKQPDNGSIMVICAVVGSMMIMGGMRLRVWLPILLLGLLAGVMLYWLSPHVQARFDAFLHPLKDPKGSSWQLINALIAQGRGGFTGVGLGDSIQKTGYLPEVHTDFIYSMIGEELGFMGTSILITLFALLVHRLFTLGRIANMRGDLFGAMYIYGVAVWIGFQTTINIMVNTGWFPTKGLTLPFVSYGSSSLMMFGLALGIVFHIQRQTRVNVQIPPVFSTNHARAAQ